MKSRKLVAIAGVAGLCLECVPGESVASTSSFTTITPSALEITVLMRAFLDKHP
jgi:hypothetical protein